MPVPPFDYATLEAINTWHYMEGPEGSMAIARLHSRTSPDVTVALFAHSARHQNAFENLFATKAKFGFTVQGDEISIKGNDLIPDKAKTVRDGDPCSTALVGAYTVRAIFYPVC